MDEEAPWCRTIQPSVAPASLIFVTVMSNLSYVWASDDATLVQLMVLTDVLHNQCQCAVIAHYSTPPWCAVGLLLCWETLGGPYATCCGYRSHSICALLRERS